MKKIIMLAALVLASCSYDYKVKVDTDTIKYVVEYPAATLKESLVVMQTIEKMI